MPSKPERSSTPHTSEDGILIGNQTDKGALSNPIARKMVARMLERGHPVFYYENIEGGHSAAADLKQTARRKAMETVYLLRQLKD